MKSLFPGYYRPSEEEFDRLWKECTFTFDANVLLNLYRYSSKTREELFTILEALQERIWLAYQPALEFQENRLAVIRAQAHAFDKVIQQLPKLDFRPITFEKNVDDNNAQPRNGHTIFELLEEVNSQLETLKRKFEEGVTAIQKELEARRDAHPDWTIDDPIRDRLDNLFEGKVGNPYSDKELIKLYDWGEKRYAKQQPPGFADKSKRPDDKKYGDFVMWRQVIDHAKGTQTPIIMITNDNKEDWWGGKKGQRTGPHSALLQEFCVETGVQFYLYTSDKFMERAQIHLNLHSTPEAIEEVAELEEYDRDELISNTIPAVAANAVQYSQIFQEALMADQHRLNDIRALSGPIDLLHNQNELTIMRKLEESARASKQLLDQILLADERRLQLDKIQSLANSLEYQDLLRAISQSSAHVQYLGESQNEAVRLEPQTKPVSSTTETSEQFESDE